MSEEKKAIELLMLLGLSKKEAEHLLNSKKPKMKQPTPARRIYKEYVLSRTFICKTCVTSYELHYHMVQMTEHSGLISSQLSQEAYEKTKLPIQKDWAKPSTCEYCMDNLTLLTKKDLAIMLLDAINEKERYKNA